MEKGCSDHMEESQKKLHCMNSTECHPHAPVAEGGSEIVRIADRGATGGTDGTGSPGTGGVRAASGRLKSDVKLYNAFVLINLTS